MEIKQKLYRFEAWKVGEEKKVFIVPHVQYWQVTDEWMAMTFTDGSQMGVRSSLFDRYLFTIEEGKTN